MTFVRNAFTGLTGAFLVLLPLQFLFAGVGVFGGDFGIHEAFGGMFLHLLTLLMTIFALIGKQWKFAGLSFALFIAIGVQVALVEIGQNADSPWISALHPFMAFLYWPYVYFLIWLPWKAQNTAGAPPSEPAAA
jgi:hypothetical protein